MTQNNPPALDEILTLEKHVWQALMDGDPSADGALLAEDFLGVYPDGFSDKAGHTGQLEQGPTMAEYMLSEARLLILGPDDVLLAYRADYRRALNPVWEAMYISSIWTRSAGGWRNRFSQDTPAA